eukprot:320228_1
MISILSPSLTSTLTETLTPTLKVMHKASDIFRDTTLLFVVLVILVVIVLICVAFVYWRGKSNFSYSGPPQKMNKTTEIELQREANNKSNEVYKWLESIGLATYYHAFAMNGFVSLDFVKEIRNTKEKLQSNNGTLSGTEPSQQTNVLQVGEDREA